MAVTDNSTATNFGVEPLPPPVHEILAHRELVRQRYPLFQFSHYRVSRVEPNNTHGPTTSISTWLGHLNPLKPKSTIYPDTPSASLYRMYEFLIAGWTVQLRNELEYFCCEHPAWSVASIPDPADDDNPLRYAVLATLTKLLCVAFNRRVELGLPRDAPAIVEDWEELARREKVYEEPPEWTRKVQPMKETVYIPDEGGKVLCEDDEGVNAEFKVMNIIICEQHIHFV